MAEWRADFLKNHPPGAMGALELWRSLESTLPLDDDCEESEDPSEEKDETDNDDDDDASEDGHEDEEADDEDHPERVAPVNVDTALFDEAMQLSGGGSPRLQATLRRYITLKDREAKARQRLNTNGPLVLDAMLQAAAIYGPWPSP